MTEPTQQRLFFALWPDSRVRRELLRIRGQIGVDNGRPVHPDDLHATLVFLGQVGEERLPDLMKVADGIQLDPFDLSIDRFGWWKRPRILWCAPSRVSAPLIQLFHELQDGLAGKGFTPETRPYSPHVTLARKVRHGRTVDLDEPVTWPVHSFALVTSRTHGDPPRYQVIKKWPPDS